MRFHNRLYIGDSIKHPIVTKWKLRVAAGQFNVHVIVISENGDNQLECFHNSLLKQKSYHKRDFLVVGIAGDYKEAVDIIAKITQDCVTHTGTGNVKQFLLNQIS